MEEEIVKVNQLSPQSKKVNVVVKVLSIGETKEIASKFGGMTRVTEAVVGDETGTILMSLWEDQVNEIKENEVIEITNGYVSLVRSHMRLNVGKYGSMAKSETEINEVNEENDMSSKEYEYQRRRFDSGRRNRGRERRY